MSGTSAGSNEGQEAREVASLTGPWSFEQVVRHFEASVIPLRLATTSSRGPAVQSLWFEYRGGFVWCATQSDALAVRRLRNDPRCGFEVAGEEPPYFGVRGFGIADILPAEGRRTLEGLLARYGFDGSNLAGWLLSRADNEVAIRIDLREIVSWDFRERM